MAKREDAGDADARRVDRRLIVAGLCVAIGVLTLAAVAWVKVPDLYPLPTASDVTLRAAQESARSQGVTATRASVLAAVAGLAALVTIMINYRNSRTAIQTLAVTNETLRLQQRTFAIQQRAHLTDRYTKAIEQLGNAESIAIRLGGIYALEQIAVDTDRAGDQATVVEVLSSFVRLGVDTLRAEKLLSEAQIKPAKCDAPNPSDGPDSKNTDDNAYPLTPPRDVLARRR